MNHETEQTILRQAQDERGLLSECGTTIMACMYSHDINDNDNSSLCLNHCQHYPPLIHNYLIPAS